MDSQIEVDDKSINEVYNDESDMIPHREEDKSSEDEN